MRVLGKQILLVNNKNLIAWSSCPDDHIYYYCYYKHTRALLTDKIVSATKQREKNTTHMTDSLTIQDKKQQATVPGGFKETAQVSKIKPYFSSLAAQLLLNFW